MTFQDKSQLDKSCFLGMMARMTSSQNPSENLSIPLDSNTENTQFHERIKSLARKYKMAILLVAGLTVGTTINAQSTNGIDYSVKSNQINPDTLNGDNLKVFNHFVDLTSEEAKKLGAQQLKAEFEKLGLTTKEKKRFIKAYFFYTAKMTGHKISCENWEEFKYLESPKDK